jgi:Xaa-Pro aminopeptidase
MTHIKRRLAEVRRIMKANKLPALLVSQEQNRRYLSGFKGSAGMLLITQQHAILSTDFRYWAQAAQQAPDFALYQAKGSVQDYLPGLIEAAASPKRVGFESGTVTVAGFETMKATLPTVRWVKTNGLIEQVRWVKDADEIAQTRRAIELAENAFADVTAHIEPGMTEAQIAWELEVHMRTHGATGLAFDTIVASGPNAALPHYHAGERPIQEGEPITIDWGAELDGYRSDLTRTIVIGEPDAKFREVYDIVLKAQVNAINNIKANTTGKEADAFSRDIIAAAGYGEYFGHSLGHGVGLATHEGPRASWLAEEERLPAGTVITIEPGIYIPGWGGVRIEDMIVVNEHGVEVLSHLPK